MEKRESRRDLRKTRKGIMRSISEEKGAELLQSSGFSAAPVHGKVELDFPTLWAIICRLTDDEVKKAQMHLECLRMFGFE